METEQTEKRERAAHLGPVKRRPMVLDAALEIFAEQGYEGTSMDAVAEKVGVTKPVVYECYPNKLALFEALLDREEKRMVAYLEEIVHDNIATASGEISDQMVIDAFVAVLKSVQASPMSWRVLYMTEHGTDREVSNRIERGRRAQIIRTTAVGRARLVQVGFSGDLEREALIYGNMMVGVSDALVRLMLSDPKQWSPAELGSIAGQLFAHGDTGLND